MSEKKTLLVEVGMEEAPPWFLEDALQTLPDLLSRALHEERLSFEAVTVVATPRRLAMTVRGLDARQPDEERIQTGPSAKVAVGGDGSFLPPALKFAEKMGASSGDLTVVETEKGRYVAVKVRRKGMETATIVSKIVPAIISESAIPHRRSMRWGESVGPFIRPVHWLVVLLDDKVVPTTLFGVASDRLSYGHRFHCPGPLAITSADSYEQQMEEAYVIVDQVKRAAMIRERLLQEVQAVGGVLEENPQLLAEVTNLVEWPVVLCGSFDRRFLDLPPEVIITVMAKHQRYFAVRDPSGALLPLFLVVAGTDPALKMTASAGCGGGGTESEAPVTEEKGKEVRRLREAMIKGYERVLAARLEDARFFFPKDLQMWPDEMEQRLGEIIFQKGLGSYLLKAHRLRDIAEVLAKRIGLDEQTVESCRMAAALAKVDLASSMVFELPELQGVMGGIYAARRGESPTVATAIAQHYLPNSASDPVPSTVAGAVVSVADKLDSLVAFFALGRRPSATSDPLGLRRLAIGVIRIILEAPLPGGKMRFNLREIISLIYEKGIKKDADVKTVDPTAELMDFFKERLKALWQQRARADLLDAVIECGVDDIGLAAARLEALLEFQKSEDFEDLAVAFKRAFRISRELAEEGVEVDPALFTQNEEKDLFEAVKLVEGKISRAYAEEDFKGVFANFKTLRRTIDAYFDRVFVNVKDEPIRRNRLAAMKKIADLVAGAARLDLIQFERTKL